MPEAIKIENLSKLYRLGQVGTGTLSHDVNRALARLCGKPDPFAKIGMENRREEAGGHYVWALKDINLDVEQGDVLGIIGRNGAGKSTLLKLLSRVTGPTTGCIKSRGRIASLLEVGTGFHPELTGRENIYLNGSILGMRRHEVSRQLDAIVEFSGCAKYLDTPVKRYSSGMMVRLGFAVAAHLECEILIVDEVLAVGDFEFQKRCLERMSEISSNRTKTILFVSHNLAAVKNLCSKAVLIDYGKVLSVGAVSTVVQEYLARSSEGTGEVVWKPGFANAGEKAFEILALRITDANGEPQEVVSSSLPFFVELVFRVNDSLPPARVGFIMTSSEGLPIIESYDSDVDLYAGPRQPGVYTSRAEIPGSLLNRGRYYISVNAGIPKVRNLAYASDVLSFFIESTSGPRGGSHLRRSGVLDLQVKWNIDQS